VSSADVTLTLAQTNKLAKWVISKMMIYNLYMYYIYYLTKKGTIHFRIVEFYFIWNALKIFFGQKCQMDVHQLRIWLKLCQNLAQRFHSTTS